MLVPAIFTSAVAVSVALGIPQRSPPLRQSIWIAVVTRDGDILASRDDGASAIVVARCPVLPMPAEQDSAPPGPAPGQDRAGDEPDPSEDPFLDVASPAASSLAPTISDIGDTGEAQHLSGPARSACGLRQPPAQIAWRQDALYVACAAGPVYRWREDTGSWPVQLAAQREPDDDLPGPPQAAPDRIVAMLGGAELRLADASQRLWLLKEDSESGLRLVGAVPEPVAALAEWQGALVVAGATAVWRRSGAEAPWEPLVTIGACALSADRDSLWLAGAAGLVELTGPRVRIHTLAPLTGIAIRDGDIWLASGRDPVARAPLAAVASAMRAGAFRRAPEGDSSSAADGVTDGKWLRAARARARWARWLPAVVARARWSRSRNSPGPTSAGPWLDPQSGSNAGEIALVVWLTWRLDPGDSAATAAARSWP